MRKRWLVSVVGLICGLAGCIAQEPSPQLEGVPSALDGLVLSSPADDPPDPSLAGAWNLSWGIITLGPGQNLGFSPAGTILQLNADATWSFGSFSGTWSVGPITSSDWTLWQTTTDGATRKIVLDGWDDAVVSGPIYEQTPGAEVIMLFYPAATNIGPGIARVRFGRFTGLDEQTETDATGWQPPTSDDSWEPPVSG